MSYSGLNLDLIKEDYHWETGMVFLISQNLQSKFKVLLQPVDYKIWTSEIRVCNIAYYHHGNSQKLIQDILKERSCYFNLTSINPWYICPPTHISQFVSKYYIWPSGVDHSSLFCYMYCSHLLLLIVSEMFVIEAMHCCRYFRSCITH